MSVQALLRALLHVTSFTFFRNWLVGVISFDTNGTHMHKSSMLCTSSEEVDSTLYLYKTASQQLPANEKSHI